MQANLPQWGAEALAKKLSGRGLNAQAVRSPPVWAVDVEEDARARGLRGELTELLRVRGLMEGAVRQDGLPMEAYKPFEPGELVLALADAGVPLQTIGAEDAARLWHELVWSQGFPNGNHRTALLFVVEKLNKPGSRRLDPMRDEEHVRGLFAASKGLIPEKEFAPDPASAKRKHLDAARAFFGSLLNQGGGQSS